MKTILIALTLLLAAGGPAAAQESGRRPEQMKQRLEAVQQRLALTPEQLEQVRPILEEEVSRLRELRDKPSGSRRGRRSMANELRDIRSETDEKLKRVLSKTQMDELNKIREEWRREYRKRAR